MLFAQFIFQLLFAYILSLFVLSHGSVSNISHSIFALSQATFHWISWIFEVTLIFIFQGTISQDQEIVDFGILTSESVVNITHSDVFNLVFLTNWTDSFNSLKKITSHLLFLRVFSFIQLVQNLLVKYINLLTLFNCIIFLFSTSSFNTSLNIKFSALVFILISGVICIYVLFTAK